MKLRILGLAAIVALLCMFLFSPTVGVSAHQQMDVNNYHMEVGFFIEPAIEGQMNGIDLRVTDNNTQKPVTGLESTLQVEITCIQAKASQTFSIQPVDPDGDPGHYNNGFIPTTPGQYSFRFFGTINGTSVNQTFISGPDTFSDVLEATGVEFPQKLASLRELDSVARASQATAQQAQDKASTANTLGILGIVFGALGIGMGSWALISRRK